MNPTPQQTRDVWERISQWWNQAIGEGNDFQKTLIIPATDELLEATSGQTILDVACGNGNYSRHLAKMGARVVACDFCQGIVNCAKEKSPAESNQIEYCNIDATDEAQLLSLGEGRFDSAVCSMAMMDMPTIEPLLFSLHKLLKPGGRFVFSVSHPCFNTASTRVTAELKQDTGNPRQVFGVAIEKYLSTEVELSNGILNQPEPHYSFHRPLSALLAACFQAGFVVDGFLEPAYPAGTPAKNPFAWAKRPEIPPAVVIRIRK
jgi:2-polyprenyl-3-methyl-5-hydroxy-6-metoxy-1,4-benzoquinol methylase